MSAGGFFGFVAGIVNRYPGAVIVTMVLLAVIALFFMASIPTQTMSDEYMDKQSPAGIIYDLYNNRYGTDTYMLFIRAPDPTDPQFLSDLLILEKQIGRIAKVDSVSSLADAVSENNGGVIPGSPEAVQQVIDSLPPDVQQEYMPDRQSLLAYIVIEQGVSTDASENIEPFVVSAINQATLPPGVSIELTGNTPYNIQIEDDMMTDFNVLIIAAMGFMLVVKYLLYSKIRFWILPVVLLTFGLFYTFGIMGLLGIPANDGALAAFPILLGLGIDYAVQFHMRFDDERRRRDADAALVETLTKTGPSVMVALGATSLGFLAMFITPIPMIQTFATVALLGIICCYFTALFGFGAFAHVFHYVPKPVGRSIADRVMKAYDDVLSWVVRRVVKIAMPVVLITVVIGAVGIAVDHTIPVDASQKTFAPPDLPAQRVADEVQSVAGSLMPLPLYVRGIDTTTVDGITWTDRLCTEISSHYNEVSDISGLPALVKSYNNGVLPVNQAELDQVIESIPPDQLKLYKIDDTTSVIVIDTFSMTINEQRAFSDNVVEEIAWLEPPPGAEIVPTGDYTLYTILTDTIIAKKDQMTMLGFVLIFFFLLIVYRKGVALTPLVPIICVIGWNPLAMVVLGQDYSIMTAVLGSMTIGVGSEYTILVMERYLEEKERMADRLEAIHEAVLKVGSAVVVSGLVTAAGFSALLLSAFPILASFGLATIIVVIFSLLGAAVIMPATLALAVGFSKDGTGA